MHTLTSKQRLAYHMAKAHKLGDPYDLLERSKASLQRQHGAEFDGCTWRLGGTPTGNAPSKRMLRTVSWFKSKGVDIGTRAPVPEDDE